MTYDVFKREKKSWQISVWPFLQIWRQFEKKNEDEKENQRRIGLTHGVVKSPETWSYVCFVKWTLIFRFFHQFIYISCIGEVSNLKREVIFYLMWTLILCLWHQFWQISSMSHAYDISDTCGLINSRFTWLLDLKVWERKCP